MNKRNYIIIGSVFIVLGLGVILYFQGPKEKSVADLIAMLKVKENTGAAVDGLTAAGEKAVGPLSKALADPDAQVRAGAGMAFQSLGPLGEAGVPALIGALKDQDRLVRGNAAAALGAIGKQAETAVPALAESLGDAEASVRKQAAMALGKFGGEAKSSVPAMLKFLATTTDDPLIYQIGLSLTKIDSNMVPDLITKLEDTDMELRKAAAYALSVFEERAKDAVPALIKISKEASGDLKRAVAIALWAIDSKAAEAAGIKRARLRA